MRRRAKKNAAPTPEDTSPAPTEQVPPTPAPNAGQDRDPDVDLSHVAPLWGWRHPNSGRALHVTPGVEYQGTTTQVCGLFPFTAGAGTPVVGTPIGRHQLHGEVVCLDPLEWLREGLVTNPGVFVLGQPGTGKSTFVKRLITGAVATGTRALILGDSKPDYTDLTEYLDGQVIRIGRGLDRINPLDSGPMGKALKRMSGPDAEKLRWEVRSRRLSLLLALCTLVREGPVTNVEEVLLGRAMDLLDTRLDGQREPTVPDVLRILDQAPDDLVASSRSRTLDDYRRRTDDLVFTLDLLCSGSLAGVFDDQTSKPIDLDAPIVSVDISATGGAGDKLLTAAMLCTWAYGFGLVDASASLAQLGLAPRRNYMGVMDELWRALRGAPGLVEHADSLTRLSRAKGMASVMVTHSLADLEALPTEEDRAKARGLIDRSAVTVMAGLPPRELARVHEIMAMTPRERAMITSWAAPDSWQPDARHPGRGKIMIKVQGRQGLPVDVTLTSAERRLYDTDQAIRAEAKGGR
ncbi:hypothetical protein ABZ234_07960 [Nocardiopsis sp. NPDC006198]|uniref:hypothetical protein n=1 Tax=Nocardiopsis sp. NPDC006198 TaxID=3154472 RepID=UPI0033ACA63C